MSRMQPQRLRLDLVLHELPHHPAQHLVAVGRVVEVEGGDGVDVELGHAVLLDPGDERPAARFVARAGPRP